MTDSPTANTEVQAAATGGASPGTGRPSDPLRESVRIRPAAPGDLPALLQFLQPFVEQGKLIPRTLDELEELLPGCFVAVDGDRIVGSAALEIYSQKMAELRSLAVDLEYRRHGVGSRLVAACVDLARSRNVLEVMAITSSERFFVSCGFDFTLPGEKKALFYQTSDPAEWLERNKARRTADPRGA